MKRYDQNKDKIVTFEEFVAINHEISKNESTSLDELERKLEHHRRKNPSRKTVRHNKLCHPDTSTALQACADVEACENRKVGR